MFCGLIGEKLFILVHNRNQCILIRLVGVYVRQIKYNTCLLCLYDLLIE